MVVTLTTPPLLSLLGNAMKMLRGSRHFIWEMDMYPDVAVDCGYFRQGSAVERSTGFLADWSRRHADGIMALGECMPAIACSRAERARTRSSSVITGLTAARSRCFRSMTIQAR